jgi:hypothetical protein
MARGRFIAALHQPVKPPVDAEGVAYTVNPAAPGLKFFSCSAFRAVLSQPGCASRWREAQTAKGHAAERFGACRGCPIGAAHAGERFVRYSRWYGLPICPRCRTGGLRMIGNRTCVSCYNRNRELRSGRNGRGNKPVEVIANAPRNHELRVSVDGHAARVRVAAVDLFEPMIQTMRTARGEVEFGFAGVWAARQGRLF